MNQWIVSSIVAFFAAILSAMGMGGGGILLIYLTAVANIDQLQAQGMNLAFFIPIGILSLIIHQKNHLISWKKAVWCIVGGIGGVFLGHYVAQLLGSQILRKVFGVFLLIIGIRELFGKVKPSEK